MKALQTKSLLSIIDKSFCARQGTQQVSKVVAKDFAIDVVSLLSEKQKLKIAYANNLTGSKSVYEVTAHEGSDTYIHTTSSYKDAQNHLYYGEITEVKNYMPSDQELAMFFTSEFPNVKEIAICNHSYDWDLGIHSLTNATGGIILEKELSPDDFYLGRFYGFIPIYM